MSYQFKGGLGRKIPSDWKHVEKYPLAAVTRLPTQPMPVVLGMNWYGKFDTPQKDSAGRWWIAKPGDNLGFVRGGHAICVKCAELVDPQTWWVFYNQMLTGECVGFSNARARSLVERRRFDPVWLYMQATLIDWIQGNEYDPDSGTEVRAALEVERTQGLRRMDGTIHPEDGIASYHWATSAQEVLDTIKMPLAHTLEAVPLLQSWGMGYPHIAWMPLTVVDRLLAEDGEAAIVLDR